jgi:hypothetical protein
MQVPNSTNSITSVTFAPNNFANRVAGQPLFLHSLNSHKVNPLTTFFLNPNAWSNPATGTYSNAKPYYGDYRTARYPNEQLGLGKSVPIKEGVTFSVRADFFNVFNRWAYPPLNNTYAPVLVQRNNYQRLWVYRRKHCECGGCTDSGFDCCRHPAA